MASLPTLTCGPIGRGSVRLIAACAECVNKRKLKLANIRNIEVIVVFYPDKLENADNTPPITFTTNLRRQSILVDVQRALSD